MAVHALDPEAEKKPEAQPMHAEDALAPDVTEKLPAAQLMHVVAPLLE